jgi:glycerophosphoryl diester phosphodiesterase
LTDRSVEADAGLAFAHAQGHAWVLPAIGALLGAPDGFAERVHASGMRVGTWICDDPDEAVELMRAGVDAVATNDPGRILAARRRAFGA